AWRAAAVPPSGAAAGAPSAARSRRSPAPIPAPASGALGAAPGEWPPRPGRALHRALDADEGGQERVQEGGLAGGGLWLRLLGRAPDQPFHGLGGLVQPGTIGFRPLGLQVRVGVVAG